MTGRDRPYEVGFGRPPVTTRFQKGVSVNPNGRPRKAAPKAATGPGQAQLDDILLAEALRPITVWENEQTIEMPMIQAVLRSLGVQAVKGHHKSQLVLANMVKAVQSAQFTERSELFQKAIEYKDSWNAAFQQCDLRGKPRPEPVPRPAEIVLDMKTMDVLFNGPATDDEKAQWDQMLKLRDDCREEIADYEKRLKRPSRYAEFYAAELDHAKQLVEMISAVIPDERTRRRSGFDIRRWREGQPVLQKMLAERAARERRTGRRSAGKNEAEAIPLPWPRSQASHRGARANPD